MMIMFYLRNWVSPLVVIHFEHGGKGETVSEWRTLQSSVHDVYLARQIHQIQEFTENVRVSIRSVSVQLFGQVTAQLTYAVTAGLTFECWVLEDRDETLHSSTFTRSPEETRQVEEQSLSEEDERNPLIISVISSCFLTCPQKFWIKCLVGNRRIRQLCPAENVPESLIKVIVQRREAIDRITNELLRCNNQRTGQKDHGHESVVELEAQVVDLDILPFEKLG